MARTMTGVGDPRTSKRLLFLALVLAVLSAGLVYVTISRNAKTEDKGGATSGPLATQPVVVAKSTIPARSVITIEQLEVRQFPANLVSQGVVARPEDLVGKVTREAVVPGEQVLDTKVVGLKPGEQPEALSATLPEGMRAMSISVSQVVSAGGLILPGDYVDIIGSFDVKIADKTWPDWFARTVLENIQVLAVDQSIASVPLSTGVTPTASSTPGSGTGKSAEEKSPAKATTMTLLVSPEQSVWLFWSERKGTLRAIVRSYGDGQVKTANIVPPSASGNPAQPGYVFDTELFPSGMPLPVP